MRLPQLSIVIALLALITPAAAQPYPNHPIKLIVPISVGSITDVAARLTAQELQERLGQPVVVVNRPGAAMVLGGTDCAKAPADGYTLCLVSPDTMAFNPLTIPNLPYDPDKDFAPVINMYIVVEGLIVPAALPVDTIEQFHAKAVAGPAKLNYGTLGERTTTDAFRQWLGEHWNTSFVAIPYKGGSEITSALLGNTIDVAKIGVGNMVSQINDQKVKVLAITASHRWPQMPNTPTFAEAGFGAYPGGPIYWGLVVPTGTPAPIVKRLHDELFTILKSSKFTDFANQNFLEPAAGSAEDFVAFLKQNRASAVTLVDKYFK
jgi:tripartite-type tricarboxylate transporter receptor subunit TctC